MKPTRLIAQCLSAGLLLLLATGCTHMETGVQPIPLPSGRVSQRRATLVLTPSLSNYKYEFHRAGDAYVYPFGAPLRTYAQQVAERCFQRVAVVPSIEQAAAAKSSGLILIPRVVRCAISFPVWGWDKANMTLVMEWTAKDAGTRNTIWLKTITADASEPMGSAFTAGKHQRILIQKLFDNLSLKTYSTFQEAPALR